LVLGAVALITIGYLAYQKFIAEPKQRSGKRNVCKYFQRATDGVASDSLYKLSLKWF
jgi:hypothetical protein